jgi:hypothetical protein
MMRQALHIFKKDVRGLLYEIVVTLGLVAAFTLGESFRGPEWDWGWVLKFMLPLAWWNLVARVIYAEALPGDRQFWVTRPYDWKSLLASKSLFILASVNLPKLAADAVIVSANGFQIQAHLGGLLWNQALLLSIFVLPMAVIAAVTSGFVQLFLTALLAPLCFVLIGGVNSWRGLQWILYTWILAVLTVGCLVTLVRQYAWRRTTGSRILAVAAIVVSGLGSAFFPWNTAFALQGRLAKQQVDGSLVRVTFDRERKPPALRENQAASDFLQIELPIRIEDLPEGTEVLSDAVTAAIEGQGAWRPHTYHNSSVSGSGSIYWLEIQMERSWLEKFEDAPANLRLFFYLTLFGNKQRTPLRREASPIDAAEAGRCQSGAEGVVICLQPFRQSYRKVSAETESGQSGTDQRWPSYSPFPAEFGINPITVVYSAAADPQGKGPPSQFAISSMEPLAHIRRDVEFHDVHLGDYVGRFARNQ